MRKVKEKRQWKEEGNERRGYWGMKVYEDECIAKGKSMMDEGQWRGRRVHCIVDKYIYTTHEEVQSLSR